MLPPVVIIPGAIALSLLLSDTSFLAGGLPEGAYVPTFARVVPILGVVALAAALDALLPGKIYPGPRTPCGDVPLYKDNALKHCAAANLIFFVGIYFEYWELGVLLRDFECTIATLNLLALLFCAFLYVKGLAFPDGPDAKRSGHGFVHDFFWGVELHPKFFGVVDIKRLLNCRVSMTFWMLHGVSALAFRASPSLIALAISQWLYLVKFFYWEPGYMYSLDITLDKAGFYETWGVLVFVPSVYTVHTRVLMAQPEPHQSLVGAIALGAFSLLCVFLNWSVDAERQTFRRDYLNKTYKGSANDFILAKYTTRDLSGERSTHTTALLCSGWWGWSRHPQYVFELGIAWSWAALGGNPFSCWGASMGYAIVLTAILVHRVHRDEDKCALKYGKAYSEYRARVPWCCVPGLW